MDGQQEKLVICAENIENVNHYFNELLHQAAKTEAQRKVANSLVVPDTIVDRICSSDWPSSLQINTETFHELAVDQSLVPETHLSLIPAVENIDAAFARKRLMVNTYADAASFLLWQQAKAICMRR